jgi:hypothetical protein
MTSTSIIKFYCTTLCVLQVMGFSAREECNPESLRAARKLKALAVHPDKVGHDHPGANLAAGRVNKVRLTEATRNTVAVLVAQVLL